jgi:hypothetical protein
MAMVHARLKELRKQLSLVDLHLSVDEAVRSWLEYQAVSSRVGSAQRLDRLIRSDILEPLAELVLTSDVPENKVVALSFDDDLRSICVKIVKGERTPVTESMESPAPSSPPISDHSSETDDEVWADVSAGDSLIIDEEEDGPPSHTLRPRGPPVLATHLERLF